MDTLRSYMLICIPFVCICLPFGIVEPAPRPDTDELMCETVTNGSLVTTNSIFCPASDNGRGAILIVDVDDGGNSSLLRQSLKNLCDGKQTCDLRNLRTHLTEEPEYTVNYQCIEATFLLEGSGAKGQIVREDSGLLQVTPGQPVNLSMPIAASGVFFVLIGRGDGTAGCDNQLFISTSSSSVPADQFLPVSTGFGVTCVPKNASDDVTVELLSPGDNQAPPFYPESRCSWLIYFEGVANCNETDVSEPTTTDYTSVCRPPLLHSSPSPPSSPPPPGPSPSPAPSQRDTSVPKDTDDEKEAPHGDGIDKAAVIGVVVSLAVVAVIVIIAVSIAKYRRRKRRERERPLVDISPKIEVSEQNIQMDEITNAKGYLPLDLSGGFEPPHTGTDQNNWSLSPATSQKQHGLLNASFTDAIDLDANESNDGTRPAASEEVHGENTADNSPTSGQGTEKTDDPTPGDGTDRQNPDTYESAFEGSLEDVVSELEKLQDSDSLKSDDSPEIIQVENESESATTDESPGESSESGEVDLTPYSQPVQPFTLLEVSNDDATPGQGGPEGPPSDAVDQTNGPPEGTEDTLCDGESEDDTQTQGQEGEETLPTFSEC